MPIKIYCKEVPFEVSDTVAERSGLTDGQIVNVNELANIVKQILIFAELVIDFLDQPEN